MEERENKNYYEVLEIPTDASADEVYRGYVQAKNTYSQDSLALYSLLTRDECDKMLELIEEAYTILSDPEKRIRYNKARKIKSTNLDSAPVAKPSTISAAKKNFKDSNSSFQGVMSRIVAHKRFALDFTPNSDVEKKIEQTSEFTGSFLKEIREYKNVDISRMTEMTRVSKTYLRNIEDEEWDNLPATVYVRGFVYQYAKCLKLNPDMVATSYIHRLKRARKE